ncbi:endonuclease/exonuclease/phosphatase family protein [Vibrio taketomensis]|uniref:endonuclease/exonuclease/phosphatase family protein n=1 Tax=Vibrio taketomensis TaxID=2572923 RepID=UPI00138A5B89|nr:endonuclease/exonuclease/phosphatase family protein [Vibrio taketomensis]
MKKKVLIGLPIIIGAATLLAYHTIFTLPEKAQVSTLSAQVNAPELACYNNAKPVAIDNDGKLNVLVWNIYKQNRSDWQPALTHLAKDKQLLLLQEASLTPALRTWIDNGKWSGNIVDAFKAFDTSAGVLNLAHQLPKQACAYTEMEPWLRLPKSAIYATYALSNQQILAVVNIHAINFTYGTEEYYRQLDQLATALAKHNGPMIVAGDFNSWSRERLQVMKSLLDKLGVKEAVYTPDHRKQFINGLPLDHLFYRGLVLEKAKAPISDASDHNPMEVSFRLLK